MIKTILVDDHRLFSEGVEKLLDGSGHFKVIEKFKEGRLLLENIQALKPDLVLLDIDMPGLNGLDVIKRIRINNATVKIVFLSMHEESVFFREASQLGANGYLIKSIESNQLIESLLKVCNGIKVFPVLKNLEPQISLLLSER